MGKFKFLVISCFYQIIGDQVKMLLGGLEGLGGGAAYAEAKGYITVLPVWLMR